MGFWDKLRGRRPQGPTLKPKSEEAPPELRLWLDSLFAQLQPERLRFEPGETLGQVFARIIKSRGAAGARRDRIAPGAIPEADGPRGASSAIRATRAGACRLGPFPFKAAPAAHGAPALRPCQNHSLLARPKGHTLAVHIDDSFLTTKRGLCRCGFYVGPRKFKIARIVTPAGRCTLCLSARLSLEIHFCLGRALNTSAGVPSRLSWAVAAPFGL